MSAERGWRELDAGEEFAGYRIERRLGRGGMGILYLAVESGLERRVALKLIAPEAAADPVFARRFAEETRIAASIEHPNVVPIYAAGEEDGVPFIAMRYVAGSDLGRRLAREGRLDPAAAVELAAQIGSGLDAIHAAGLVHRDVKPANVLLGGDQGAEHAYITDFGVARNVATESGLTQTGRFVGTLDFVAPEQISGDRVDARADVYALGCLLFKLLTGEVPFPRDAEAGRLFAHLNDPPPAPSAEVAAVPAALDQVVARAMAKRPADRYPSAGDLGRAAVAALGGTVVTIPERAVATGAAATLEAETVRAAEAEQTIESAATVQTAAAERAAADKRGSRGSRSALIVASLAAFAAAAAAAVLLLSGGGDTGGGPDAATGEGETTAAQTTNTEAQEVLRLSDAVFISKADESCALAKKSYVAAVDRAPDDAEVVPNVSFAKTLVEISSRQVTELQALVPPAEKEAQFKRYLNSREEVAGWDKDALDAAREGNRPAYEEAYARRDDSQSKRQELADEIGFEVCSQPNSGGAE